MPFYNLIKGSSFSDKRGNVLFFNSFDMGEVVRMYEILPADVSLRRGWQGHKFEKKWFYCGQGSFEVKIVEIDNFESPASDLKVITFVLSEENPMILEISGGYATCFKANHPNSKLTVFSDFTVEQSKQDDFRFDINNWQNLTDQT